jgi:hypothetical protein
MAASGPGVSELGRSEQPHDEALHLSMEEHILEIEANTDDDVAEEISAAESPMTKRLRLEKRTGRIGTKDLKMTPQIAAAVIARPKSHGSSVETHHFTEAPPRENDNRKRRMQPQLFQFAPLNFQSGSNAESDAKAPKSKDW